MKEDLKRKVVVIITLILSLFIIYNKLKFPCVSVRSARKLVERIWWSRLRRYKELLVRYVHGIFIIISVVRQDE